MQQAQPTAWHWRAAAVVVTCSALIVVLSMGIRQSFGIFLQPVSESLSVGREVFSLAVALQNIMFGVPLLGILADRYGARLVALPCGLLYGVALFLLSMAETPSALYVNLGLLTGLALAGTSYVVVLGAVAQVVPPSKRSTAFGLITAAGSFGMFLMIPFAQRSLSLFGWENSFMILAAAVAAIALLSLGLPNRPRARTQSSLGDALEFDTMTQALNRARRHGGYWLLNAGFFVCGFHVAFIATHLPAFLSDSGVNPMTGATALSLIGIFNIGGSFLFGYLGDQHPRKWLLTLIYTARGVVITMFLLLPVTGATALLFGGAIGFLWLATVPLTSGMVAGMFGSRYLSTLYGIVFLSHQIGAFLGVWLGGRLYDTTGSYEIVWLLAVGLSIFAALVHLPISDAFVLGQKQAVGEAT